MQCKDNNAALSIFNDVLANLKGWKFTFKMV